MQEEIQIQRHVRKGESPGIEIVEYSSPETDLACPYFHQRFVAEDASWLVCEGRFNGAAELVRLDLEAPGGWRLTQQGAAALAGDLGPKGHTFHCTRQGRVLGVDALSGEETRIWAMPEDEGWKISSHVHLNADSSLIALSGNREHPSGQRVGRIWSLSLADGSLTRVIERPFQIGHVQFSTGDPDLLMYCHETGGASPQRMWLARVKGKSPGALFDDPGHPWVTHESFCGNGEWISFIRHPEGMGMIRKDNTDYIPIEAEGAWHCAANREASALVFDTHQGEIRLWDKDSGLIRVLSGSEPYALGTHAHPRFLPGDRGVVWTSTREGRPHVAIARMDSD